VSLPTPTPFLYTVKSGDTLSQLAERFHVSLDDLMAANPSVIPDAMAVGQQLRIPSGPANPGGKGTATPAPLPVDQIDCHRTSDGAVWCFMLIHNDTPDLVEDVTAQVSLVDPGGRSMASRTALLPLDIVKPGESLPLSVFFPPGIPPDTRPQVRVLAAIRVPPNNPRYLPATIENTSVEVATSGLSARLDGEVFLPADSASARLIWVAAVAYDGEGNVVSVRRWESAAGLSAGNRLPCSFMIWSVAGPIEHVQFAVEARP
jgi:LysM repeat protein